MVESFIMRASSLLPVLGGVAMVMIDSASVVEL